MNFLIDTNIINYLLRGNGTVRERFDTAAGEFLLSLVVDSTLSAAKTGHSQPLTIRGFGRIIG